MKKIILVVVALIILISIITNIYFGPKKQASPPVQVEHIVEPYTNQELTGEIEKPAARYHLYRFGVWR